MAEILLRDYLISQSSVDFEFAKSDCATFVLGWLDCITGKNGVSEWSGRYSDSESCDKFIDENGGFVSIANDFFGKHYNIVKTETQSTGNIVFVSAGNIEAMGIRVDGDLIVMRFKRGLIMSRRCKTIFEWDAFRCQ
jgi:hypothetical protein